MTEKVSSKPGDLTDIEKSAVVMMSIGQEAAAEVLKFLSPPEIDRLLMAMARISEVSKDAAAPVLEEYARRMQQNGSIGIGGIEYVRGIIEKALATRRTGRTWVDTAYDCGFADQAHMINDFNAVLGASPERALGGAAPRGHSRRPADARQAGGGSSSRRVSST